MCLNSQGILKMMKVQSILSYKLGKIVQSPMFYLDNFTFKNTQKAQFKFGIFYLLDHQGYSRMGEADLCHLLLSHYLSFHSIKGLPQILQEYSIHFLISPLLLTRGFFASTWDWEEAVFNLRTNLEKNPAWFLDVFLEFFVQ